MIAFIGIAFVLVITLGGDTMLVLRSVPGRGREAGLLTIAGITAVRWTAAHDVFNYTSGELGRS
jgi:threonine/homoserine/homoserine lactone efflux protein